MQKFWIIAFLNLHAIGLSLQVVVAPCRVENILTQPIYGTSLAKKAIVQIIQIPPVFTQNVMIGKCVSAKPETSAETPLEYFVCTQRYSSVEVYITDHFNAYTQNGSEVVQSPTDKFKSTHFLRDTVAIESGCDFTFNLLPLLLQKDTKNQQRNLQQPQSYHFLQSPYHPKHPEHLPLPPFYNFHNLTSHLSPFGYNPYTQQPLPPNPNQNHGQEHVEIPHQNQNRDQRIAEIQNLKNENVAPISPPNQNQNQNHYQENLPPIQNQHHNEQITPLSPSTLYQTPEQITQIIPPRQSHENHDLKQNHAENQQPPPNPNDHFYGQLEQGGKGGYSEKGGGIISVNHPVISPSNSFSGSSTSGNGFYKARESGDSIEGRRYLDTEEETQGQYVGQGDKTELYSLSDKIGVPLYILSREFDPLLNNIEGVSYN